MQGPANRQLACGEAERVVKGYTMAHEHRPEAWGARMDHLVQVEKVASDVFRSVDKVCAA